MTTHTIHPLVVQQPTIDTFSPYGFVAAEPDADPTWVASGSRVEGVVESHTHKGARVAELWRLGDLRFDGDVPYLGFVRYHHQGFEVAQLERHPHETQTFLAIEGTSFIVLAPPTNTPPPPTDVAAFVVEPGTLIALHPGTWMCHFFPIANEATYAVVTARREPEQDRDLVDLRATANTVLRITLS